MVSAGRNGRGSEIAGTTRRPLGVTLLVAFFVFGASMALFTLLMLLFRGSVLDSLWRLNPEARLGLQSIGRWAIVLMASVATACGLSAVGLAKLAQWGRMLAVAVLVVNLLGDVAGALIRGDPRTLIGVPIGGALILYLMSNRVKRIFVAGAGG
jgi:hypothetical protein